MNLHSPDLKQHPPRSPRARLGGYALLPRCLDKGRATLAGKNGEYHYACPLDQEFLNFAGIDPEALKKEIAVGHGDGDILAWIQSNAKHKHSMSQILAWSAWQEGRPPDNPDSRAYFNKIHQEIAPKRKDIVSWCDLLDLDDFVSYGGKA
jgi:hypothetical protein